MAGNKGMGSQQYEVQNSLTNAIGIDECNYCTSFAGDVVVAACWLPLPPELDSINDSKKLTHKQRLKAFGEIVNHGTFSVVPVPAAACRHASLKTVRDRAMAAAAWILMQMLEVKPAVILVDGAKDRVQVETIRSLVGDVEIVQLVGGDANSYLIGAASIVAKVYVDSLFWGWSKFWPGYGLESNHGTMTPKHREALRKLGASPVHRIGYGQGYWEQILSRSASDAAADAL
jgi:ribonuclease HII